MVQWFRIHLPLQETPVWSLVQEDFTCHGATKPMCHNYWAQVLQLLKPVCLELQLLQNLKVKRSQLLGKQWRENIFVQEKKTETFTCERTPPIAGVLQQEKPLQWEAHVPQLESSPCLPQLGKNPHSNKDPVQPKIKMINKIFKNQVEDTTSPSTPLKNICCMGLWKRQ